MGNITLLKVGFLLFLVLVAGCTPPPAVQDDVRSDEPAEEVVAEDADGAVAEEPAEDSPAVEGTDENMSAWVLDSEQRVLERVDKMIAE